MSKNVYIDKLVDKYNNTYHSTIKIKPVSINDTYMDHTVESNYKNSRFKVSNDVRISKYKNIFAEDCTPNWSEEVSIIKKIKNTVK